MAVSTTWTADKTYVLTDKVFVTGGATLTIDPGTRIYSALDDQSDGDATNDEFGAVIVTRGSMIDAAGTCEAPIIFDS
ncbi:MAG: cell shape-determining protein MreB, partial [Verrucomicrobia bacterium]|nr:cell shape-determining protein MreB [Verrucomicrobiota bacterium]